MPFPPRLVFPLTRICGSGPPVRLSALAGLPLHPFWCHEWGQSASSRRVVAAPATAPGMRWCGCLHAVKSDILSWTPLCRRPTALEADPQSLGL